MCNSDEFLFFPDGIAEIGIDSGIADTLLTSLGKTNIKREHIEASSPVQTIKYKQFFIQKNLLTVTNFRKFIIDTSYVTDSEKEGWGWVWIGRWLKKNDVSWRKPFYTEADLYYNKNEEILPVMQVSWNDAVEYTRWLSAVTGDKYRLPFEYEWEIFGNFAGLSSMDGIIADNTVPINSDNEFIMAIDEKIQNSKFQTGILWEWTLDWYNGYDKTILNKDFGNIYKILRGGSLLSENIQKSREFRFRRCPTARSPYYGFRLVLEK